jgi:hypothetical protein
MSARRPLNEMSTRRQLHVVTPGKVHPEPKNLIRITEMLFHVEQNVVSRETDCVRTCVSFEYASGSNGDGGFECRSARWCNKKGGSLAASLNWKLFAVT